MKVLYLIHHIIPLGHVFKHPTVVGCSFLGLYSPIEQRKKSAGERIYEERPLVLGFGIWDFGLPFLKAFFPKEKPIFL